MMMNRSFSLLLCLFMLMACSGSQEADEEEAGGGKEGMAVDVVVLEEHELGHRFTTSGDLIPNEEVELRSQISGKIERIDFREGEKVRKGELLLHIDVRDLKAQKDRLKAEMDLAEKELERLEELRKVEGVSQEELDRAINRVETLEAEIRELQVSIDRASIEAPFSGRIGLRRVSKGDLVDSGTRIAKLVKEQPLKMDLSVPSSYAKSIEVGERIGFGVDEKGKRYEAKVIATEPMMDASTRSLEVRAILDEEVKGLMAGTFVEADVLLRSIDTALMVPSESLLRELNSKKVWRIRNGKAEEVEVETGLIKERAVQLTEGVRPGDSVLVTGLLQVREGMPLRVRNVVEPEPDAERNE
jgi:membrane fusion protein (multidrug efflux system)